MVAQSKESPQLDHCCCQYPCSTAVNHIRGLRGLYMAVAWYEYNAESCGWPNRCSDSNTHCRGTYDPTCPGSGCSHLNLRQAAWLRAGSADRPEGCS